MNLFLVHVVIEANKHAQKYQELLTQQIAAINLIATKMDKAKNPIDGCGVLEEKA